MLIQKDICTQMFIAALFTIGKIWKPTKCPLIYEWIKKMWYILHTMGYYSTIKAKLNLAIYMDGSRFFVK